MPGVDRLSISEAVREAGEAAALGLPAVLLFGIPADKDAEGSGAWDDEGVVQLATFALVAVALERTLARDELGPLRSIAQGAGIATAFAVNYVGSLRFAWSLAGARAPLPALELRRPGAWIAPTIFAALDVRRQPAALPPPVPSAARPAG